MRILALDWGSKRIGGAITDEQGIIAFPLDKYFETSKAKSEIPEFVKAQNVSKIIVGNPLTLSGEIGGSSQKAQKFAEYLKTNTHAEVILLDERFTSETAKQYLQKQGLKEKDYRPDLDNVSAQNLLSRYLEQNKN